MTPAEHLRAAAQLARETAEAATPDGEFWANVEADGYVIACAPEAAISTGPNVAHSALWSPPVALAVAAWLEAEAKRDEWVVWYNNRILTHLHRGYASEPDLGPALAVADALLQTQPVKP